MNLSCKSCGYSMPSIVKIGTGNATTVGMTFRCSECGYVWSVVLSPGELLQHMDYAYAENVYNKIVTIGMHADMVVYLFGNPTKVVPVGRDSDGFIVEWHYPGYVYTMAYAKSGNTSAYAVQKIERIDENDTRH